MEQPIDDDLRALVDECERGRDAWIHGRLEFGEDALVAQAPDMTIFGPFGGEASRNGPEFAARQPRIAARFGGGTGRSELVKVMRSGDLVVLVLVERSTVTFAGRERPQPWVLRTTQVFRRDGDRWLRLHRHADPLIRLRSFDDTLDIAAEDA